jgi:hypothetical protein
VDRQYAKDFADFAIKVKEGEKSLRNAYMKYFEAIQSDPQKFVEGYTGENICEDGKRVHEALEAIRVHRDDEVVQKMMKVYDKAFIKYKQTMYRYNQYEEQTKLKK